MDLKAFYRRMTACFAGLGPGRGAARFASRLAPALLKELGGPLGVDAAHVYADLDGGWSLGGHWGASRPDVSGQLGAAEAGAAAWVIETPAGRAGAVRVGDEGRAALVLFGAHPGELRTLPSRAEFLSALHAIAHAADQHLHRDDLETAMEQAHAIQRSLLPAGRPPFDGFDVFAASVPAAEVGGDLYDFTRLDAETLALTVADASGHGLPAALQARDVAIGIRMGVERDLKITRLVEKLNRIIHRSGVVTRFVSLVLGELESNGNFAYVNAGHPPGLLIDEGGFRELAVGGPVLGPMPDAVYKLGFAHVDRGAALALVSDGVLECRDRSGSEFGTDGLREWLAASRDRDAEVSVADLYERLRSHSGRKTFDDDVTALLVRRPRG